MSIPIIGENVDRPDGIGSSRTPGRLGPIQQVIERLRELRSPLRAQHVVVHLQLAQVVIGDTNDFTTASRERIAHHGFDVAVAEDHCGDLIAEHRRAAPSPRRSSTRKGALRICAACACTAATTGTALSVSSCTAIQ